MSEGSPLDRPLGDSFFNITDVVDDPVLIGEYYELCERLRAEAETVPSFGTLQIMMIERVAFFYIYMKVMERGLTGEEMDARKSKELMNMWTKMFETLNSMTRNALSEEELRTKVVREVVHRVNTVLDMYITDQETARNIKSALADSLQDANF